MSNPLREAIETGEAVLGARATTHAPTLIEVYGDLGLDFVWLDFEHGGPSPYDSGAFEAIARAGDAAGIEPLVRLPSGDPPLVRKALDAGMRTLLIPRVDGPGDVRPAVEASRFAYDGGPGERGYGAGRPARYGAELDAHVERADDEVLVGAMIESRAAVERIDEVLSVPDLGFAFVGPGDLSVSYGRPGERDHPDVRGAIETAREACLDAGVPIGFAAHSDDGAARALEAGYRLVRIGGEVGAVRDVLGDRLDALPGRA
ncbi:MAG: HpcH/HpaI aldolase/citrate lyase family protein [Halobacteriales archaeon]